MTKELLAEKISAAITDTVAKKYQANAAKDIKEASDAWGERLFEYLDVKVFERMKSLEGKVAQLEKTIEALQAAQAAAASATTTV